MDSDDVGVWIDDHIRRRFQRVSLVSAPQQYNADLVLTAQRKFFTCWSQRLVSDACSRLVSVLTSWSVHLTSIFFRLLWLDYKLRCPSKTWLWAQAPSSLCGKGLSLSFLFNCHFIINQTSRSVGATIGVSVGQTVISSVSFFVRKLRSMTDMMPSNTVFETENSSYTRSRYRYLSGSTHPVREKTERYTCELSITYLLFILLIRSLH